MQATGLGGQVDGSRIALWGVSYAGGHVLVTAATFGSNISAVIANVSAATGLQSNAAATFFSLLKFAASSSTSASAHILA